jgi:hypothetical protein
MVTALSIAVAALLLAAEFFATWVVNLRARSFNQAAELPNLQIAPDAPPSSAGDDAPQKLEAIPVHDDEMDIPAALVGARCKEAIERFAPFLGTTPVNLLRAALKEGLTGGHVVTKEMLDVLEEEAKSTNLPLLSKPGPSLPN